MPKTRRVPLIPPRSRQMFHGLKLHRPVVEAATLVMFQLLNRAKLPVQATNCPIMAILLNVLQCLRLVRTP